MTGLKLDVMTALSRVAYGDDNAALDYLQNLTRTQVTNAAFGLACIANSFMELAAVDPDIDIEQVRDDWLAQLTDAAHEGAPSP